MHNNIESAEPWRNPRRVKYPDRRRFILIMNEFISVTKLTEENKITDKLKFYSTQSKALRKAKEIAAMGLPNIFERSGLKFYSF